MTLLKTLSPLLLIAGLTSCLTYAGEFDCSGPYNLDVSVHVQADTNKFSGRATVNGVTFDKVKEFLSTGTVSFADEDGSFSLSMSETALPGDGGLPGTVTAFKSSSDQATINLTDVSGLVCNGGK